MTAVYPGSFDPVHNGHVDIAKRASKLFDRLIIAVYESPPKNVLFSTEERVDMFKQALIGVPNIEVVSFSGLVAPELVQKYKSNFIVRGLRAGLDFETEFEMTLMWRNLHPQVDVVCLMSALENQFIYSSRIKEVAKLGGNVTSLVPNNVATQIENKLSSGNK